MKGTTRDNILYLAIALGIVGIGWLIMWHQEAHGQRGHMPISDSVFGFLITIAVVFGAAIHANRRHWRRLRFWLTIIGLFAVYFPLQWRISQFSGARVAANWLAVLAELLVAFYVLDLVMAG